MTTHGRGTWFASGHWRRMPVPLRELRESVRDAIASGLERGAGEQLLFVLARSLVDLDGLMAGIVTDADPVVASANDALRQWSLWLALSR